jgi:hypothetical protein
MKLGQTKSCQAVDPRPRVAANGKEHQLAPTFHVGQIGKALDADSQDRADAFQELDVEGAFDDDENEWFADGMCPPFEKASKAPPCGCLAR